MSPNSNVKNFVVHPVFLDTLAECCERTGFRIHSYVLMTNHYHLLVETPEANLVE